MPKGRPKKVRTINPEDDTPHLEILEEKLNKPRYANSPTDFDQVALFNQLFANIFDRNRTKSMAEVLDFILAEGGIGMDNQELLTRTNKLGLRADLYTPRPNEDNQIV